VILSDDARPLAPVHALAYGSARLIPSKVKIMKSRGILLAFALVPELFGGQAAASRRDDVLQAMGRCAAITDSAGRLACYDGLAPRLRDALATPPPSLDHEPTKAEQESWFGFNVGDLIGGGSSRATTPEQFGKERTVEAKAAREAEEIESISSQLTEVSFTPFGQFIVFLKNGQVWRQLQGDADRARFKSHPTDNTVTISHGALGSYNLKLNGSDRVFKVSRLK